MAAGRGHAGAHTGGLLGNHLHLRVREAYRLNSKSALEMWPVQNQSTLGTMLTAIGDHYGRGKQIQCQRTQRYLRSVAGVRRAEFRYALDARAVGQDLSAMIHFSHATTGKAAGLQHHLPAAED